MLRKAEKKRIAAYLISLLWIILLLFCPPSARCQSSKNLHLYELAEIFNIDATRVVKAKVLKHLLTFVDEGFSKSYRLIYDNLRENVVREKEKLPPMLALIMICNNFDISASDRLAGKRLFLRELRQISIDTGSFIAFAELEKKTGIFKEQELKKLFHAAIRQVWARNFKTELFRKKSLTSEMKKFLGHFSWLKQEVEASLARSQMPEEKWEYVLIEGRSGENEGDFELKKVK